MKKLLVSLMLFALIAACLVSCGGKNPSPEVSVAGTKLDLATLSEYSVVFTDGDDVSFNAAMKIKTALDAKVGSSLRLSTSPEATDTKQIVVGGNDVATTLGIDVYVRYYDYDVRLVDNTIFVCAESSVAADGAVEYLLACLRDDGLDIADYWYDYEYAFEYVKINGIDISEYQIVAEKSASADALLLKNAVLEKCGVAMSTATEKEGRAIVLESSDGVAYNTCKIAKSGEDIVICGNGVNGTYLGVCAFIELLDSSAAGGKIDMTIDTEIEKNVSEYTKNLSAYKFFDENGNLDVNGTGEIKIAFIGGSLTQNRSAWTNPVCDFFRELFPNKTVTAHNAGIGATNSEFAAARLEHDVFEKMIPDVLFVEFAVNDGGFSYRDDAAVIKNGVYIESIVKQCQALENKPVIIFLYAPHGQRKGNNTYSNWHSGVRLKAQIGDNYGISGIDIWQYFEELYIEQTKANPSLTYDDFLLQYYAPTDMLHPMDVGFAIYGDAIVKALRAEPEKFLMNKINAPTYLTKFEDIVNMSYELVSPKSERLSVEGNFKYYRDANQYDYGDPRAVTAGKVAGNQLSDGVIQFEDGKGSIALESSADVIKLYGINSSKGMKLDVICDGEKIGVIDTNANNDYLYMKGVDIPDDGKDSHTIKITPSSDNGDNYVFRVGFIVEGFKK